MPYGISPRLVYTGSVLHMQPQPQTRLSRPPQRSSRQSRKEDTHSREAHETDPEGVSLRPTYALVECASGLSCRENGRKDEMLKVMKKVTTVAETGERGVEPSHRGGRGYATTPSVQIKMSIVD
jgi:hypothetical protein